MVRPSTNVSSSPDAVASGNATSAAVAILTTYGTSDGIAHTLQAGARPYVRSARASSTCRMSSKSIQSRRFAERKIPIEPP